MRFDGSDLYKMACEHVREQAHAREQIPCEAAHSCSTCGIHAPAFDQIDERGQQEAIHLKEAAALHPVAFRTHYVCDARHAPLCQRPAPA